MKNFKNILFLICFVFAVSNISASPPGEKEVVKTEITKHQVVDLQMNVAIDVVFITANNVIFNLKQPSNIFRAEDKTLIVTNVKANISSEVKPPDLFYTKMSNRQQNLLYDSNNFEFYLCNYL